MSSNSARVRAGVIVRGWVPLVIWLAVIGLESTPTASAANTRRLLFAVVHWLFGPTNAAWIDLINTGLRKGGHFVGYGLLGVLFFRALRTTSSAATGSLAAWSVGLTLVVASLDEFHQTFMPSRTGCVRDVLLDTAGAACLLLVVVARLRVSRIRALA